ncbi:hypothetical protein [Streptomyces sp. DH24]|uniref:hypothetical protein n=1 Tax=Streptomyces sp. DH24 TaxID=3040123 RepID=UPI002441DA0C|nr:hypothetical protein [Streptomyces sp. DH24]MDG9719531.1 hypothetical protein [Streptomyces sp. DH24]
MRKLPKAALAAAMIGSLTMAGAGIASAGENGSGEDGDVRACVQVAEANNSEGLINLPINLALLGNVQETTTIQQVCNNGDKSHVANVAEIGAEQTQDGLL